MADGKNSVIVYTDWINKFEALEDDEAGRLIKHFFRYINDLNPTPPDRITQLSFIDIEQSLKRDLKKWEKEKDGRSENGALGNLKRWNPDLYEKVIKEEISMLEAINIANSRKKSHSDNSDKDISPPIANIAVNVSVTDTVNATVNEIQNKDMAVEQVPPTPIPPTIVLTPETPKKKEETKDYLACVDFWLKEFHPDWTFGGVHGKAMKSIIKKLSSILKDTANVPDSFRFICQNLPQWFKDKDLQIIDSKFNEIITEIKKISNGQIGKDGKQVSQYHNS